MAPAPSPTPHTEVIPPRTRTPTPSGATPPPHTPPRLAAQVKRAEGGTTAADRTAAGYRALLWTFLMLVVVAVVAEVAIFHR